MVAPAWAIPTPNVLIAIAVSGPVSYEWACNFAEIWANRPPGTGRLRLQPYVIDQARESGAKAALDGNFKWLFFLDTDVFPPPDVIQRLMAHSRPIVSGFYARRHEPIYPLLLRKVRDNPIGFDLILEFAPGSLVEVDACPAGCMLVSTEVFRKVTRPWFYWTADRAVDGLSEDYFFTQKAQMFGYKTFVDTGLKCRHLAEIHVLPTDDGKGVSLVSGSPNP